jgi:hypothetical protein
MSTSIPHARATAAEPGVSAAAATGVLPPVSQTNLRLYNQLHRAGYARADLLRVRDSYELATVLFAGQFRGSGKPFLAHLVGTASLLAGISAAPDVVVAGLMHAAYDFGEFGIASLTRRRRRIRQTIGEHAEALVWSYHTAPWSPLEVPRLCTSVSGLSEGERSVVLMRLANELEDNLDLAMHHCHPAKDAYRHLHDQFVTLARLLGYPDLAHAFLAIAQESAEGAWADELSLNRPASYRLASRFGLRLVQRIDRTYSGAKRWVRTLRNR